MIKQTKIYGSIFASLSLLALVGCSNYKEDVAEMRGKWQAGNYAEAAIIAEKNVSRDPVENVGGNDLVWQLEYAAMLKDDNKTQKALNAFRTAYKQIEVYESRPVISLTDEIAAMATNVDALPYRGRNCDKVMLHTYAAMLNFEKGDKKAANISLNRAAWAGRAAATDNDSEIAKKTEKIGDAKEKTLQEQAMKVAQKAFREICKTNVFKDAMAKDRTRRAAVLNMPADELENYLSLVYENPYQQWLNGVNMLYNGNAENAKRRFKALKNLYPKNRYVLADLKIAEGEKAAKNHTVYVVFESGEGPTIGERGISFVHSVELPGAEGSVSIPFAVAWPTFKPSKASKYWGKCGVEIQNIFLPAEEVCDMDAVLLADFNSTFPAVMTRAVMAGVFKAVLAAAVNSAANKKIGGLGAALVNTASSAAVVESAEADVRAWQTLPRNFSIVRIDFNNPKRNFFVRVGKKKNQVTIKNSKARVNIVFVKTVTNGGPIKITQGVIAE